MERKQQILQQIAAVTAVFLLGLTAVGTALAAPFGKVVPIGGHASDLALDEARGVLYVANFTANRIEEVSLADGSIRTSMNVSAQPSSLAISPDSRYLVVGHFGNFTAANAANNALTVIDLTSRARQTFAMGVPVLGVAFGADGRALISTTADLQLFDPVTGTLQLIDTVSGLLAKTLPATNASAPATIVAATVAASGDGRMIYGVTDAFRFHYDVERRQAAVLGYTSSPALGPRAIAVSRDGSTFVAGWVMFDRQGLNVAQFGDANGSLEIGSHAFDSARGRLYSQVPTGAGIATPSGQPPVLQVLDSDNLRVRERLQLGENLTGKSVLSRDGTLMYSVSASGVTILPVGSLEQAPRVTATEEDIIFRGNFCDRRTVSQEIAIVNPGGGAVDFTLSSTTPGIRFSPSSGVTPATVRVSMDPAVFQNIKGTLSALIEVKSANAVNIPAPIRVLINNREPDQRGTIVNIPGKLVDILQDPVRERFYVLRQDTNEVLVYDGATYVLQARLRTSNTPTQMAITFDRRFLLVGHDNAQIATMYDLETLEQLAPIRFPGGHYPRSIAASGRAILAASRVAGAIHTIDRIDLSSRTAVQLSSLGVYENSVDKITMLMATPNGSKIIAAQANGGLLLYDANADTFTISRKEGDKLSGAVAASSFDQFVVGNRLLNASLVPVRVLDASTTVQSAGFVFVDQAGFRTAATDANSAGLIQRVDLPVGQVLRATRMAEAPVVSTPDLVFTRTLAPLYSRNAIVNLTTSGFTVLPWNYDAAVAAPRIERVVSAADGTSAIATGGLVTLFGSDLSPVNLATRELPLPTALGESCLTVNGVPAPMMFVSPSQINAQIPYFVEGNATMVLRTPGGVSDNINIQVRSTAPTVFRNGAAGPQTAVPAIVRSRNNQLVTLSNPVHRGDNIVIYLTGMGRTFPAIEEGVPGPGNPPLLAQNQPTVTIGGEKMTVNFAGLAPGQVGVYQINADVPGFIKLGVEVPIVITQSGGSTSVSVRVVE